MDKVKIIDLKPYFTQPSLYPSQSRKFWTENQGAILEFITSLDGMDSFFNIHAFAARVDNYLSDPYVCGARESYLILGKPLDISAHDYGDAELQKLVTDQVLASTNREQLFVVISVPRPDKKTEGQFYSERYREQYGLHQQDPWEHVTNDMLVQLLNHFSLTQILPFMPIGNRVQVPSGLELVQLIQSRLMPPDYRGYRPGPINQFDPRFSGGFNAGFNHMYNHIHSRVYNHGPDTYNQPYAFRNPQGGVFDYDPQFQPAVTSGRYARHSRTGAWTWYPNVPFNAVYAVDKSSISPRDRTRELIGQIASTLDKHRPGTGRAIDVMMEEITFALNNHEEPKVLELLGHDKVILFVGGPLDVSQTHLMSAYGSFSNWILLPSEIDPEHPKAGVAGIARATHMPQKLPDSFY